MRKRNQLSYSTEGTYTLSIYALLAVGIIDALYVSYMQMVDMLPPYTLSAFVDCGNVLRSPYSSPLGIPLVYLGLVHFLLIAFFLWKSISSTDIKWKRLLFLQTALGVLAALYELYLQFFVIKAVCWYVMIAVIVNLTVYFLVRRNFQKEYKEFKLYKKEMISIYMGKLLKKSSSSPRRTTPKPGSTRIRARK